MRATQKRKPLIIIYDVPANKTEEEICETIYEQNISEEYTRQEFSEKFKIRFRTGQRGRPTTNYVAEVDPCMRKKIIGQGRLYVGFSALGVRDYVVVTTCNKCQNLGHAAKYCHQKNEVCSHCGKEGHRRAECPDKEKMRTCIPCTR